MSKTKLSLAQVCLSKQVDAVLYFDIGVPVNPTPQEALLRAGDHSGLSFFRGAQTETVKQNNLEFFKAIDRRPQLQERKKIAATKT